MKYGIAFDHCHIDHEHHVSLIIKIGWIRFLIFIIKLKDRREI